MIPDRARIGCFSRFDNRLRAVLVLGEDVSSLVEQRLSCLSLLCWITPARGRDCNHFGVGIHRFQPVANFIPK